MHHFFLFSGCTSLDLIFAVDNSQQVSQNSAAQLGPNWNFIKTFLINTIEEIVPPGQLFRTRIGLVIFSATATYSIRLDDPR